MGIISNYLPQIRISSLKVRWDLQTHPVLKVLFRKKSLWKNAPSKCSSNSCAITANDLLQHDLLMIFADQKLHDALERNKVQWTVNGLVHQIWKAYKAWQDMMKYDEIITYEYVYLLQVHVFINDWRYWSYTLTLQICTRSGFYQTPCTSPQVPKDLVRLQPCHDHGQWATQH